MGKSYFWKGIIYGALAGGALSLLDKSTRENVMTNCKKTSSELCYYMKHPKEAIDKATEVANQIKTTVEQVSEDITYITEKVEELNEGTPKVAELLGNTKQAFLKDK